MKANKAIMMKVLGVILITAAASALQEWNWQAWQTPQAQPEQDELYRLLKEQRSCPGTKVEGEAVGELTRSELHTAIAAVARGTLQQRLQLNGRQRSYVYTLEQLGLRADTAAAEEAIWRLGRSGSLAERMQAVQDGCDIPLTYFIDDAVLRDCVQEISRQEGVWMDAAAARQQIDGQLKNQKGGQLKLPQRTVTTAAQLMDPEIFKDVLGAYQTTYDLRQSGRSRNLSLAAEKINGIILQPGEAFSFNAAVGPVTAEEGYQEGSVLVNGQYVPGVGGGICQISTTLYAAVLKSELTVTERHNHGFPASYIPMGLDAAVAAEAGLDFCFFNNTEFPICLWAYADDGFAEVRIYGTEVRKPERQLSFYTEMAVREEKPEPVIQLDASKPIGYRCVLQEGRQGGRVDTYRQITENGTEKVERISVSYYKSSADWICVGTGER